jgi:hypothetical protein
MFVCCLSAKELIILQNMFNASYDAFPLHKKGLQNSPAPLDRPVRVFSQGAAVQIRT